jgi:arsenite methyltransferase
MTDLRECKGGTAGLRGYAGTYHEEMAQAEGRRGVWWGLLASIVTAGLLSRTAHTGFRLFDKYLGDSLYAAMVYVFLRLTGRVARVTVWAAVVMTAIEFFQLTGVPAGMSGSRYLGIRVFGRLLGTEFSVLDLLAYAVGIGCIAVADHVWLANLFRAPAILTGVRRGDYGYDAPYALIAFASLAVVSGAGLAVAWLRGAADIGRPFTLYFVLFLMNASSFWYTTRRGKFVEWERILDGLHLRGDELVLDMGCGRGAVLTAAARRLKTGSATGVDIWSTMDQSGNAREVTLRNASLEGVADRVKIETADMRKLPFPDASFDVVVSSLAIHNIKSNADRRQAIREGLRVLRPGGRMAIADIRATGAYVDELRSLGASNVERRRLGWRFWWGNPVAATKLITARKPLT